ncbi:TolC family protein [Fulvivirga lutea]|uniref:TolC family protein n=1 Tax=Fulvivirga lutea TaxID=2810512 RepID=A0A974WEL1_9BACT|nr:TolC family protein [Fulvivirga lutea]QSE96959.1 TolC family protein [Fulvivirga lutea]
MRQLLLIVFLFVSVAQGRAQDNGYTLQECIDYALTNNQNAKNAEFEKDIADAQVRETVARGLPQVNINSGLNYNYELQKSLLPATIFDPNANEGDEVQFAFGQAYDGNIALSARQLLFDGSFFVGLQAAKTYKELSTKDHIKTQIDVIEAVSKAYYNVLVNEERYELLEVNLGRLDTLLTETQAMYESGFAEKIDVSRIKVQHNNLKVQIDNTKQLLDLSRDLLKFQMGMKLTEQITLSDKLEEVEFTVIDKTEFDYNNRIEYSQLQTNLALVNLDMKNNRVQYLPALYANFSYGYNTQTGESNELFDGDRWLNFGTLGVTLSMPIFDGFLKSNRIQKNRIQAKQIEQSFDMLENSIDLEIRQAKIKLETAIDNMVAQKENTELAEEIYDVAKIKYQEGVGSNIEVTNADADYKEAQTNYYDALYSALVAKVELEKAYGQLNK